MTPSSATGLDEKALEAACAEYFNTSGDSVTQMEAAIRAYMSALTVTSFPPAEQHDVTSHAVPHDGEGAVAPTEFEAAYGLLWRMNTTNPDIHAARRTLLAVIGKEGQRRGLDWARATFGPHSTLNPEDMP